MKSLQHFGRFLVTLLVIGLFGSVALSTPPTGADGLPLNINAKTLGGWQTWDDTYVENNWRIQQNVLTGHYRLLDPQDVRRAWGTYDQCRTALETHSPQQATADSDDHLVILLHGILPSPDTFRDLEPALRERGFRPVAISYPSAFRSIEDHADSLERILSDLRHTGRVSFVTHSMGGLVLREALSRNADWKKTLTIGAVVQIAPPNQGSAVADYVANDLLFGLVDGVLQTRADGHSLLQLTPATARDLPKMVVPFAIIAGGKQDGDGFNPLLEGDDDGVVMITETWLAGAEDFFIVDAHHGQVANHPQTIDAVLTYLKAGSFKSRLISSDSDLSEGDS